MGYENTDILKSRFISLLVKDKVINDHPEVIPPAVNALDQAIFNLEEEDRALTKTLAEKNKVVKEEPEKVEYRKPEVIAVNSDTKICDGREETAGMCHVSIDATEDDVNAIQKAINDANGVETKKCSRCGKEFAPQSKRQRICPDCRKEEQKNATKKYLAKKKQQTDDHGIGQAVKDILALGDD